MSLNNETFVYVIAIRGRNDVCKVGFTGDPVKRLKTISASMPDTPYYFFKQSFESRTKATAAEKRTHDHLNKFGRTGEWFCVAPSHAKEIVASMAERGYWTPRLHVPSFEELNQIYGPGGPRHKKFLQYEKEIKSET